VAVAQPTKPVALAGSFALVQDGKQLQVNTTNAAGTLHSAIQWDSFNIPAGTVVWFKQPSVQSTSINRVNSASPSSILGGLASNGHLVLVNPAGIVVGADAVVDTARFTAAAMQLSDDNARSGRLLFEGGSQLAVQGHIVARDGDVLLLAPKVQVDSTATVQALQGAVMLAAGQTIEVTSPGLTGLRFEIQAPADQAVNLGLLQGHAVGLFASQLRHSGQIDVRAVQTEGGKILIQAQGQAVVGGKLDTPEHADMHIQANTLDIQGTVNAGKQGQISIELHAGEAVPAWHQAPNATLSADRIHLAGPSKTAQNPTQPDATLYQVNARELSFGQWNSVLLAGETVFDQLSFPGGQVSTTDSALLVPGGRDRVAQATVDVGNMHVAAGTGLVVDFNGSQHDQIIFSATTGVRVNDPVNITWNTPKPIPAGRYVLALQAPDTALITNDRPQPPLSPEAQQQVRSENVLQTLMTLYAQAATEVAAQADTAVVQTPAERREREAPALVAQSGDACP
jgi:filamentous hemagglutinin family protein